VDGKLSWLVRPKRAPFGIEDGDLEPRHRQSRRAWVHLLLQSVVVIDAHAHFGLAVVIADGRAEVFGHPADDFRVERFARRA